MEMAKREPVGSIFEVKKKDFKVFESYM